jgi:hypothetical protein
MVIRDEPAGDRTDDDRVIPDVIVFPEYFPEPERPEPPMRDIDDFGFLDILFETTTGIDSLSDEEIRKHVWYHDLWLEGGEDGKVNKHISNALYGDEATLSTRAIDYNRISDVE